MPSIDLKEKKELLVTRPDIIGLLGVTPLEAEIIDDIIDNIEDQIVDRIKSLQRVSIPFIGGFIVNEAKLDAIEHHPVMKAKRQELTNEEYWKFKKSLVATRMAQRSKFRSRTSIISRTVRLNRKLAARKLREFNQDERSFKLYMYFFSKMKPVNDSDYYIELRNNKGYDYEDCPFGFNRYD